MRKFKEILLIFFIYLLASCEGIQKASGVVISSETNEPIDSVRVIWNQFDETYTDINGEYQIGAFTGCVPHCPTLELIFEKKGYKTAYVNLEKIEDRGTHKFYNETLIPTNLTQPKVTNNYWSIALFVITLLVSAMNIYSLYKILKQKLKFKYLWFITILFGTMSVQYNYLTQEFSIENFRFFLQIIPNYRIYPGRLITFIPIGTIVFWVYKILYLDKIDLRTKPIK